MNHSRNSKTYHVSRQRGNHTRCREPREYQLHGIVLLRGTTYTHTLLKRFRGEYRLANHGSVSPPRPDQREIGNVDFFCDGTLSLSYFDPERIDLYVQIRLYNAMQSSLQTIIHLLRNTQPSRPLKPNRPAKTIRKILSNSYSSASLRATHHPQTHTNRADEKKDDHRRPRRMSPLTRA